MRAKENVIDVLVVWKSIDRHFGGLGKLVSWLVRAISQDGPLSSFLFEVFAN